MRAFILESDKIFRKVARHLLKEDFYEVVVTTSERELDQYLPEHFDLYVLGLKQGHNLGGLHALQALRREGNSESSAIVITSKTEDVSPKLQSHDKGKELLMECFTPFLTEVIKTDDNFTENLRAAIGRVRENREVAL